MTASFQCPSCAAGVEYDPESGGLRCPFCGHTEALPPATAPEPPHPFEQAAQLRPISDSGMEVSCSSCGAAVSFHPPDVAGTCPFCGAAIVAQPKSADPLIAPDAVLPAKISKQKATSEVRQWLQTRWFAPDALRRMARQEAIAGVYLPFWDYNASTFSRYRGQRGVHYQETEEYQETDQNGNTVTRTRQVTRTAWYAASGQVARDFTDVLVAATQSVPRKRLDALEPWGLDSLCAFEPAYLAGFKAQRYQVELPQGFDIAQGEMRGVIEEDVRRDIGGDEQRIDDVETDYSNVTFRHLLLPVWIGAYQFQNKVYQVVVNARTGEVQGERPYSSWKIALLVIVVAVALAVLIWVTRR